MAEIVGKGPTSCDTFVVMPDCTNGQVIFGKNSDRPADEVQEIIYESRKEYSQGSKVECTYITIEQVPQTNAVILSKPSWMWGAEMGANEFGVCIGNEAIFAKVESTLEERLLGMDLVRLGLERSKSASEAVDVITNLLEIHGQGGPCSDTLTTFTYHNSFLIVDTKEAWILETVEDMWAAEKVTNGFRNISNCLSIGTKIDKMSSNLKSKTQELDLWNGSSEFDFKAIFETDADRSRYDCGKELLKNLCSKGKFALSDMFEILRNKESGICRSASHNKPTAGSMVSVLINEDGFKRPHCHWLTGTPDPSRSVFKPFVFTPNAKISPYIQSPKVSSDEDPVKIKPRFSKTIDRSHLLYRRHKSALTDGGDAILKTLQDVENNCIKETEEYLENFDPDRLCEVDDLFKDCVDSELKFYLK